jgi:hypothetical protein
LYFTACCRTPLPSARYDLLSLFSRVRTVGIVTCCIMTPHVALDFQVADDLLAAHNLIRAGLGRQPIVWDDSLAQLARDQVKMHLQGIMQQISSKVQRFLKLFLSNIITPFRRILACALPGAGPHLLVRSLVGSLSNFRRLELS